MKNNNVNISTIIYKIYDEYSKLTITRNQAKITYPIKDYDHPNIEGYLQFHKAKIY